MKTLTYRRAMSKALKYARMLASLPEDVTNQDLEVACLYWKQQALALAHSDAERAKAQAI